MRGTWYRRAPSPAGTPPRALARRHAAAEHGVTTTRVARTPSSALFLASCFWCHP